MAEGGSAAAAVMGEFSCCNQAFQTDAGWAYHFVKYHVLPDTVKKVGYAECPLCVSKFTAKTNCLRHILDHHRDVKGNWKCPACNFNSSSKAYVRRHIQNDWCRVCLQDSQLKEFCIENSEYMLWE